MILRSEGIAQRLEQSDDVDDPLIITPMPETDLLKTAGAASVDLRLGTWFLSLKQSRMSHLRIDIDGQSNTNFSETHYVRFGREFILHPGRFVLGVTFEWIRLPSDLAAYVVGRSSWGRRGLIIATATGVHPGFKGCLTLELSNVGEMPVSIRPGMRICQLCFHSVETAHTSHVDSSVFVGLRRPTLGRVSQDNIARILAAGDPGEV